MPNKVRMGRNPFEKTKTKNVVAEPSNTTLFKEVVKPPTDLEKLKEMKIQIDWSEVYNSFTKGISKFFLVLPASLFFIGCATPQAQQDLKKQIVDLQKTQSKQNNQIEELNSKIYLLTDRLEHYERGTAIQKNSKSMQAITPQTVSKSGDLQIYEMAIKDLKKNSIDSFTKKVDLLVKGFKKSPLTDNALYLLGDYHYKKKNYAVASQVFEKLYSLSPDGNRAVSALYMLGLSYERQKRNQEAKEAYQTILNIYPGSREAMDSSKKLTQLKSGK